jgi:hypothetical protein
MVLSKKKEEKGKREKGRKGEGVVSLGKSKGVE